MYIHCHSYFTFKYGTMSPVELLKEAQQKGISRFALTDINNTSGILDFFRVAHEYQVKPVAGIEFRNGEKMMYAGIAKSMDGFHHLNCFLSDHLQSGKAFPLRAPDLEDACII